MARHPILYFHFIMRIGCKFTENSIIILLLNIHYLLLYNVFIFIPIQELVKLSIEKLKSRGAGGGGSSSANSTPPAPRTASTAPSSPIPQLPLNDRERHLLDSTMGQQSSHMTSHMTRSADDLLQVVEGEPPPKPPLPSDWSSGQR